MAIGAGAPTTIDYEQLHCADTGERGLRAVFGLHFDAGPSAGRPGQARCCYYQFELRRETPESIRERCAGYLREAGV